MNRLVKILFILVLFISIATGFYIYPTRIIDVEPMNQYPDMPNGCEVTSMAMLVKKYGVDVNKYNIEANLKKSGFQNADPNIAYIGNPYSKDGFYCFASPVVESANIYLGKKGSYLRAEDITGTSVIGVLNRIIFKKQPVVVWFTVDYNDPEMTEKTYITPQGDTEKLYKNLHCVVVNGIGDAQVKLVDPIKGNTTVSVWKFAKIYTEMGKRAIEIK